MAASKPPYRPIAADPDNTDSSCQPSDHMLRCGTRQADAWPGRGGLFDDALIHDPIDHAQASGIAFQRFGVNRTKSSRTTFVHRCVPSLAKSPLPPFVKGGAQRTGDVSPQIICTNFVRSDIARLGGKRGDRAGVSGQGISAGV